MIGWFRGTLRALQDIADSLGGVLQALHELSTAPAPDHGLESRVADLELSIERRAAEAEALLLKAQGKYDAARAAEERQRRLKESAERAAEGDPDLFEELARAQAAAGEVYQGDANGSEPGGMPALHGAVAPRLTEREGAYAAKWARG